HDVRVVREDGVGAGVHGGAGDGLLVHGEHGRGVADALVQGDEHDVGLLAQRGHVVGHPLQVGGVGEGVDGRRAAGAGVVELVVGEDLDVGTAGLGAAGPRLAGADAVVAEHADAQAAAFHDRGAAGLVEVHAGSGGGQPGLGRVLDGVGHALVAGVVDVDA